MKRGRGTTAAIVAALVVVSGMGVAVASKRVPVANSGVSASIAIDTSDGFTGVAITDADIAFTKAAESGTLQSSPAVKVDLVFPAGVTIDAATIDGDASGCSDEDGTVIFAANRVSVSDISCADGESLVVEIDGTSLITGAGNYPVELTFKVVTPPRQKSPNPNMWRAVDDDAIVVSEPSP